MIGRSAGGLDNENVAAADVILIFDEGLAVWERFYNDVAQWALEIAGNGLSKREVGISGKNVQLVGKH